MFTTSKNVKKAESIILNNGTLESFKACFEKGGDSVVKGLHKRALKRPELKEKIINLGFWDNWERQVN